MSTQAQDLILRLLVVDVGSRYSVEQALRHHWIQRQTTLSATNRFAQSGSNAPESVAAALQRYLEMDQLQRVALAALARTLPDAHPVVADARELFLLLDQDDDGFLCLSDLGALRSFAPQQKTFTPRLRGRRAPPLQQLFRGLATRVSEPPRPATCGYAQKGPAQPSIAFSDWLAAMLCDPAAWGDEPVGPRLESLSGVVAAWSPLLFRRLDVSMDRMLTREDVLAHLQDAPQASGTEADLRAQDQRAHEEVDSSLRRWGECAAGSMAVEEQGAVYCLLQALLPGRSPRREGSGISSTRR